MKNASNPTPELGTSDAQSRMDAMVKFANALDAFDAVAKPRGNTPFPQVHMDAMLKIARDKSFADKQTPMWTFPNMDAADSLFIARQLELIRQGLYEVQYGKLKAQSMLPFNTSIDRGVEQYTVRSIDQAGLPVPYKGSESNVPVVKGAVKSGTINFHSFGLAYEYTQQEAHAAAYANMPLSSLYAMLCRERQARHLDMMAMVGDTSAITDVKGAFNQSGTLTFTPSTLGAAGSKHFEDKAPDVILADLNGVVNKVISATLEIEQPDTLALPLTSELYISQVRVGDGTSDVILTFWKRNNPGITVQRTSYLDVNSATTPGATTVRRMVAYANDPTRLEILVSVMFDQMAPQFNGFSVKTLTETRTAGCALYLPNSMCYADDV